MATMAIIVAGCNSNSNLNTAQAEKERQEAITEISNVNKQLNAGVTNVPISTENVVSNATKFSSKSYGVTGSPRVTNKARVRKGGGRYQIGKPYTIRGKTYYPKEDPNYSKVGAASWYGPNFHGRLTANGEVYDQFALSAAHPTMPLPSYAKVTNLENGSSVIVRVNDRGPFSRNRIIDLSARAAQLLGYEKQGVAKVHVEYVGKARLDGLDEEYLVASYDPGNLNPNLVPSLPNGQPVQVAQADNLIQQGVAPRQSLSAFSPDGFQAPVPQVRPVTSAGVPVLFGELPIPRPVTGLASYIDSQSYVHQNNANKALERFDSTRFNAQPDYAMQNLVHVVFGPFTSETHLGNSEKVLLKQGATNVFSENSLNYISVTTTSQNLSNLYTIAKKADIAIRK